MQKLLTVLLLVALEARSSATKQKLRKNKRKKDEIEQHKDRRRVQWMEEREERVEEPVAVAGTHLDNKGSLLNTSKK